ncbi:hypothetical protein IB212_15730 [Enterobacter sp. E12]|uniref:hypothetical protein n=1 Tax=Enterobacter sp. E12 TaxID=2769348 RepID=UPI001660E227|nr:hypothetical protein [Enterobacter sp. E12]MBD0815580.1 hypothetical protein [Enterobacter sp. E12]
MSTITREFTKEQLQQIEAAAKEVMWPVVWSEKKAREHFSEKITPKVVLKLARIALASLEAEPAIHRWRRVTVEPYGPYPWHYGNFIGFSKPVEGIEDEYFYSAPPAPVSVPTFDEWLEIRGNKPLGWVKDAMRESYDACRAAMLQGAKRVTTANKLPAIGWLRADYQDDNRGLRGNAPLFVLGKKDPSTVWGLDYIPLTSNSLVVLDGACPCCGRKQLKNRTCTVSGCDGKHVAHGFCKKHYDIERKKDPSRRESIRAADKRYRARKAAAPQQEA